MHVSWEHQRVLFGVVVHMDQSYPQQCEQFLHFLHGWISSRLESSPSYIPRNDVAIVELPNLPSLVPYVATVYVASTITPFQKTWSPTSSILNPVRCGTRPRSSRYSRPLWGCTVKEFGSAAGSFSALIGTAH
jgi:hypothetical protein